MVEERQMYRARTRAKDRWRKSWHRDETKGGDGCYKGEKEWGWKSGAGPRGLGAADVPPVQIARSIIQPDVKALQSSTRG